MPHSLRNEATYASGEPGHGNVRERQRVSDELVRVPLKCRIFDWLKLILI